MMRFDRLCQSAPVCRYCALAGLRICCEARQAHYTIHVLEDITPKI